MSDRNQTGDRNWQAVHIHYCSDSAPLLLECVAPLVRGLRRDGQIASYFFINYWLEGPHVRLRLLPAPGVPAERVLVRAEREIDAFLARRPSLYEVDEGFMRSLYEDMFRLEFSEEERRERYGGDGRMPLRGNNSRVRTAYEPEYGKYGGPHGVALAEWHFEHSSDLVTDILRGTNVHVRTVMLGLSTQLMTTMAAAFLHEGDAVAAFMRRYHEFWHRWFGLDDYDRNEAYQQNYADHADDLRRRCDDIHDAVTGGHPERLSALNRRWAEHCAELRDRVADLATRGLLLFPPRDASGQFPVHGTGAPAPLTDPVAAAHLLLSPYLHMTNNRLGATILDESYLSYLIYRAFEDGPVTAGMTAGTAAGTTAGATAGTAAGTP